MCASGLALHATVDRVGLEKVSACAVGGTCSTACWLASRPMAAQGLLGSAPACSSVTTTSLRAAQARSVPDTPAMLPPDTSTALLRDDQNNTGFVHRTRPCGDPGHASVSLNGFLGRTAARRWRPNAAASRRRGRARCWTRRPAAARRLCGGTCTRAAACGPPRPLRSGKSRLPAALSLLLSHQALEAHGNAVKDCATLECAVGLLYSSFVISDAMNRSCDRP